MTKQEIIEILGHFVSGHLYAWDWDNFVSARLHDPELEEIRSTCLRIQAEYPAGGSTWCNAEGIERLKQLYEQLQHETSRRAGKEPAKRKERD